MALFAYGPGIELRALVGMENDPFGVLGTCHVRHFQSRDDKVIAHVIGYGPANHPARVLITDRAFVGDVTGPDHVHPWRRERAFNPVTWIDPLALRDRSFHDERAWTYPCYS